MLERKTGESNNVVGLSPGGIVRYVEPTAEDEAAIFADFIRSVLIFGALNPDLAILSARPPLEIVF